MLAEALSEDEVAVCGARNWRSGAAFTALPFNHIVFTGSPAVGRHRDAHRGRAPDAGDAGAGRQVARRGLPGADLRRGGHAHRPRQGGQLRADLRRARLRAGAARQGGGLRATVAEAFVRACTPRCRATPSTPASSPSAMPPAHARTAGRRAGQGRDGHRLRRRRQRPADAADRGDRRRRAHAHRRRSSSGPSCRCWNTTRWTTPWRWCGAARGRCRCMAWATSAARPGACAQGNALRRRDLQRLGLACLPARPAFWRHRQLGHGHLPRRGRLSRALACAGVFKRHRWFPSACSIRPTATSCSAGDEILHRRIASAAHAGPCRGRPRPGPPAVRVDRPCRCCWAQWHETAR
jgi:hypothetical protein